ncbi:MAG: phenylalanine--tRNA ligase subunit beta [Sulfolobales archaeon]
MPTVEVKISDVERIAKTYISYEELEKYLAKLKCELVEVRGDKLIYEASYDRPDLFSAEGLGRALRNLVGREEGFKELPIKDSEVEVITSNKPSYRPYVLGAVVKGLNLDDESISQLFQLQEKVHFSYCGDRALVAIGIHDFSQVKPPIYYKAVSEFTFKPLGYEYLMSIKEILNTVDKGVKYKHLVREGEYPLLIDSTGTVLSMPPIINSEYTRITPNTKEVFIDITGTELELMFRIMNLVIGALVERGENVEVFKVKVVDGSNIIWSPRYHPKVVELRLSNIRRLVGIELTQDEVVKCLKTSGFNVRSVSGEVFFVSVPPYRIDVMQEVDLIEEVAIAYGYERIAGDLIPPTHPGGIHPLERLSKLVKDLMIGLGYSEVVNFMLTDSEFLEVLGINNYVVLENPKMKAYSAVRSSLIPSLLQSVKTNLPYSKNIRLFEVGDVVNLSNNLASSLRKVGVVASAEDVTLTDMLVVLKSLMYVLGVKYSLRKCVNPMMISGRCGEVVVGDLTIGVVGEIHPRILNYLEITMPVAVMELDISAILSLINSEVLRTSPSN